jgi:hypothetical protein
LGTAGFQLFGGVNWRSELLQSFVPRTRADRRMVYFGSFKRQSVVNWANRFAGAAVVTEKLVNVNLVILLREV